MKFVSIPYNDFIYEIFIYEMLCEIFVRVTPMAYHKEGHTCMSSILLIPSSKILSLCHCLSFN